MSGGGKLRFEELIGIIYLGLFVVVVFWFNMDREFGGLDNLDFLKI